jgi:acetolactate synthase I/II/III large subunit
MEKIKASDYIADELQRQGVTVIFEMIGGMITHIIDSVHQRGHIQIVSVHHEQAGGFAAEAMGRMTGIPGVALATSGPGATNLVTAIGSCYFDSVPTVFITGQVNTNELSSGRALRQQGFQETDIVSIVKSITKAAWQVEDAAKLPEMLQAAFRIATEGRAGPVLLDIPMDIQRAEISWSGPLASASETRPNADLATFADRVAEVLSSAQRPLILAGGGIRSGGVYESFRSAVELTDIPIVLSLLGIDLLPFNHPQRVGMIGTYGNRWANQVMMECDVMVVLGSRLDVRQTGADAALFKGNRPIYHVDCDPEELNNRVTGCETCLGDLHDFLPLLESSLKLRKKTDQTAWMDRISSLRKLWPDEAELAGCKGINPNSFMHTLSQSSKKAGCLLADVGKNQMWAAQSVEITEGQRLLLSGGMGSMGFALPAAIGSVFASKLPAVCIMGDGGIQCNIQELETISMHKLPVKMIVFNNKSLGMVGQFQEDYFQSRMQSTVWGYSAPDFEAVSKAYGIDSITISEPDQIDSAMEWLWQDPTAPVLLNVMIDLDTKVFPKAAYGRPINDMDPKLESHASPSD